MYQKKKFPFGYIKDLKCRVLELPYEGKDLSMVILLPDDIQDEATGLKKVRPRSLRGARMGCVCVRVCARVHVCEHLCVRAHVCEHLYVHTHMCEHLCVRAHVCEHLCVHTHM